MDKRAPLETRLLEEMTATHADHKVDVEQDEHKSKEPFPDPEGHGD